MPSYTDIANGVLLAMGYNHDDNSRPIEAVLFNLEQIVNRLQRQRLEKELGMTGDRGSTGTATRYAAVPLSEEPLLRNRKYFTLPQQTHDLLQNGGVESIVYNSRSGCGDNLIGRHFTLISPAEADVMDGAQFQKPSPMNPCYYPERFNDGSTTFSSRIWLLGVGPSIRSVEVSLWLTMDLSSPSQNPDVEADISPDMVYLATRELMAMERFALLIPQERLQNDGRDFKAGQQPLQPPVMTSINSSVNNPDA